MVGPVLGVVVVAFELVNLVFRLDVAVLGHADVNPHSGAVDVFPVEAGIGHGLPRAIDPDPAGPGAAPNILALLVSQLIEVTNPRQGGSEIPYLVGRHAAAPGQQRPRNSGSEFPFGAVSPMPVMTTFCSSDRPAMFSTVSPIKPPGAGRANHKAARRWSRQSQSRDRRSRLPAKHIRLHTPRRINKRRCRPRRNGAARNTGNVRPLLSAAKNLGGGAGAG